MERKEDADCVKACARFVVVDCSSQEAREY